MQSFAGKKIIITGASQGLGAVCAPALAQAGATLVLLARTKAKLEQVQAQCDRSDRHLAVTCDLFDTDQIKSGIDQALHFLGGIDVVLHAAGGGLGFRDALLTRDELTRLFSLNVSAASEINRLVIGPMRDKRRGNLVHVGSIASSEAVASVGYNTVKAALAAYVRSLGRSLAADGIVATGILPGGFSASGNAMERLAHNNPEAYKNFIEQRLPRKSMGKAEELLPLIMYLCSDEASMMGGCLVPIDAGEGVGYLG